MNSQNICTHFYHDFGIQYLDQRCRKIHENGESCEFKSLDASFLKKYVKSFPVCWEPGSDMFSAVFLSLWWGLEPLQVGHSQAG